MQIISLVTGGAGFIGSHVARHLLTMGHRIIIVDDLSGGCIENIPNGALFLQGSITDIAFVQQLFESYSITYIYHLAAYAAEGLSHFIRRFNYQNNLIGSVNLINMAIKHQIKCFVFTSSIAVYGTNTLPMIESATPHPEDPYGIAKYAVELDLKAAQELFGLNYIIFRPHNVFGEHQNIGDRYRNVIGIFMNQLLQNQPLTIFGDGEQSRAFSYIEAVAPHIARSVYLSQAYNQVFNIGSEEPYSVNILARLVMTAMGIDGQIKHLPARNEVVHAYANHDKIKMIFNLHQKRKDEKSNLIRGLQKMAVWVKKHGAKQTSIFADVELYKNLPKSWKNRIK